MKITNPSNPLTTRARRGATSFAQLSTFGVGGDISNLVEASTEAEVVDAVRACDAEGTPLAIVAGGSNIVPSDEAFDGVVVRDLRCGAEVSDSVWQLEAGVPWDDLVAVTVADGWAGIEAMSGIPGFAGAAAVQNIGAYGQDVGRVVESVRAYDRVEGRIIDLSRSEMDYGYRTSRIKASITGYTPRYVVLSVTLKLVRSALSAPVAYTQLADRLGCEVGDRVPLASVRQAVLELRACKGMVLDDADRDTFSAGSFFTNPVISEQQASVLPEDAPRHRAGAAIGAAAPGEGLVKTSAAWLIDRAGFPAGYGLPGPASLSTKHCLALTNRGSATAADIRALAATVAQGVEAAFGISLEPEPIIY